MTAIKQRESSLCGIPSVSDGDGIIATTLSARHSIAMPIPVPLVEDDEAEARALAAAVAESDADLRTVPHEKVRAWLLQIAQGAFDTPPPDPH